ncbi:excalibur calcium-binding domain-containing protein [Chloroflexota bacterium]
MNPYKTTSQVNKDVHRLDGDHDGRACEALP